MLDNKKRRDELPASYAVMYGAAAGYVVWISHLTSFYQKVYRF